MAGLTDRPEVSRLEVVDTGRRRRWTEEEKLRIVMESLSGARLGKSLIILKGVGSSRIELRNEDLKNIQEQLAQAKSLKGAIMPDGSKHP